MTCKNVGQIYRDIFLALFFSVGDFCRNCPSFSALVNKSPRKLFYFKSVCGPLYRQCVNCIKEIRLPCSLSTSNSLSTLLLYFHNRKIGLIFSPSLHFVLWRFNQQP